MHPGIVVRNELARGCGRRRAGRMYLVSDGPAQSCGKMPIPLTVCPCCGMGIRPSRAPQWLQQPERLWRDMACTAGETCKSCPMSAAYETGPALLIWVGEKYYKTAAQFTRESKYMGISRFIQHVPQGFVVGQTWVLLAHRKAIDTAGMFNKKPDWQPGIFAMFKPQRIEIVVTSHEPDSVIDGYLKRGLTPVLVQHKGQPQPDAAQTALL